MLAASARQEMDNNKEVAPPDVSALVDFAIPSPKQITVRLIMIHSQVWLHLGNAATRLSECPRIASKVLPAILTLSTIARLAIGLVIAALIVVGLTNPGGAQMNELQTERASSAPFEQIGHYTRTMLQANAHDQTGMVGRLPGSVAQTRRPSAQLPEIIQAGSAIVRIVRCPGQGGRNAKDDEGCVSA
jgi:hypothetical protein